jgi:hypothetical protein
VQCKSVGDVEITVVETGAAFHYEPAPPRPSALPKRVFDAAEMRHVVLRWVLATAARCPKRDWPALAAILHDAADRLAGEHELPVPMKALAPDGAATS